MPDAGGQRLKQAIHVARQRAGIVYDTHLATIAGVSYETLMAWYKQGTPRGHELKKVADAINHHAVMAGRKPPTSYADLMGALEGREPEPPALTDLIRELVTELRSLVAEVRRSIAVQQGQAEALAEALGVLAGGPAPEGTPDGPGPQPSAAPPPGHKP